MQTYYENAFFSLADEPQGEFFFNALDLGGRTQAYVNLKSEARDAAWLFDNLLVFVIDDNDMDDFNNEFTKMAYCPDMTADFYLVDGNEEDAGTGMKFCSMEDISNGTGGIVPLSALKADIMEKELDENDEDYDEKLEEIEEVRANSLHVVWYVID